MLNSETKRRIDTARDILVGKVPDPKSQVEQITIALIYKFMDDMDTQAEEMGGRRKFFAGEFAKYGWAKLMAPRVSGEERLARYAEGMVKMPQNPGIPKLFRDIFKNAFLPYRDPETLKAFLKTINDFEYDHSERLGDAFEYLLSVLGSQGQAGQFRTPRHIIDFMVTIVDPKKTESVLDPACGTAGFLISAYKHILRANSTARAIEENGNGDPEAVLHTSKIPAAKGDLLSPDERKRLADNFRGYDISPDMVRLSLVNMYLHGFTDPHVYEYDTLTSQDRWNEMADVILANPPFMSPKGGIKPHNRFSVQSKRSEVLFVDYMAEHLSPGGRAGIIVPEGIIFQSQTAYKALRKMLVEQYLVAVISLPSGVFSPYSGVKTSILILDRSLAKQADTVGFFKVENDGFNLGAQRRRIEKNDLPQVLAEINEYLRRLRANEPIAVEVFLPTHGLIVAKDKIAANGDYNLSGERYRVNGIRTSSFPFVPIGEVAQVASGCGFPLDEQGRLDQAIPFLKVSDMNLPKNKRRIVEWNNTVSREVLEGLGGRSCPAGTVIFPKIGAAIATNKKRLLTCEATFDNNVMGIIPSESLLPNYIFAILQTIDLSAWASESQPPSMRKTVVEAHKIPLPPLEVQKEIVAEIEAYQNVIDGARAILYNYHPHVPIHPDWPVVRIADACDISSGGTPSKSNPDFWTGEIPWVSAKDLKRETIADAELHISKTAIDESSTKIAEPGSVLVLVRGMGLANGVPVVEVLRPVAFNQDIRALKPRGTLHPTFLRYCIAGAVKQFSRVINSAAHGTLKIDTNDLLSIRIPLPHLETQQAIVAEIEAEQRLVEGNRQLIERMEKKIATTLNRIWGEEPSPDVAIGVACEKQR